MNGLVVTTRSSIESVTPLAALKEQLDACRAAGSPARLLIDPRPDELLRASETADWLYTTTRRSHPSATPAFNIHDFLRPDLLRLTSDVQALTRIEDKTGTLETLGLGLPGLRLERGTSDDAGLERLPYPAIVKPNHFSGSRGIDAGSVALGPAEVRQLADRLFVRWPDLRDVRVEAYDPRSREMAVAGLQGPGGAWRWSAFEYVSSSGRSGHQIYDAHQKSLPPQQRGVRRERLDDEAHAAVVAIGRHAVRRLGLEGCVRVDIIQTPRGFHPIDVNALPVLTESFWWEWRRDGDYAPDRTLLLLLKTACERRTARERRPLPAPQASEPIAP